MKALRHSFFIAFVFSQPEHQHPNPLPASNPPVMEILKNTIVSALCSHSHAGFFFATGRLACLNPAHSRSAGS